MWKSLGIRWYLAHACGFVAFPYLVVELQKPDTCVSKVDTAFWPYANSGACSNSDALHMNEGPKCAKQPLICMYFHSFHAFRQFSITANPDQIWKINFKFWWSPVVKTLDVTNKTSLKSSVVPSLDVVCIAMFISSVELCSFVCSALPRFDTGNLVVAFTSCAKIEEGEPVSHVNQWGRYRWNKGVMGDRQHKPTWSWSRYIIYNYILLYIRICIYIYIGYHDIIYIYTCLNYRVNIKFCVYCIYIYFFFCWFFL